MIKKILAALAAFMTAAMVFAATDVNTASQAELDAVKGIGPSLSARIVEARKTSPFKDWGDLVTRVKGIGDKNSAKLSAAGLTVNGSAKSGAPEDASATRTTGKAGMQPGSKTVAGAAPAPTTATAPSTVPAATTPAATSTVATGPASAPMSAADKKAARKAAKEEKARTKAATASGAASAPSSTPARK